MLSTEQENDLVQFITEDFGSDLDNGDFVECCLQMFEDIAGLECLDDHQTETITTRLWRLYVER